MAVSILRANKSVLPKIAQTLNQAPFARVWVILATKRQEDAFRQRLIEWHDGQHVYFNLEIFNFYELYQCLLDNAGQPQRLMAESARYGLIRSVVHQMDEPLEHFHTIVDKPGFSRMTADLIYELKQNQVRPEVYLAQARTPKDRDLARIYDSYQRVLQEHGLVDREGQGWVTVEALRADETLGNDIDLLVVDGFDQFNPIQADVLALLADRANEALITLTHIQQREAIVGRRFEQTLRQLQERLSYSVVEDGSSTEYEKESRRKSLRHLIDNIFLQDARQYPGHTDDIIWIEAPDSAAETAVVLRRVKRLLLEGVSPDDILVTLRDWENYRIHFSTLVQKYGLPVALHYGEPLQENPAIATLLNVLQLADLDFRRQELLDVLGSAYIDLQGIQINERNLLDQVSRALIVTVGHETWLEAIAQAGVRVVGDEDEYNEDAPAILNNDQVAHLSSQLEILFTALTPPSQATVGDYVEWLERLIGHDPQHSADEEELHTLDPGFSLNMIESIRDSSVPDDIIARDLAAMNALKHILRSLLVEHQLVWSVMREEADTISWDAFYADLLRAIGSTSINSRPNRSGRVLVTTAADARGLPHEHVFILGLSEGVFPARIPEDPIYLDGERIDLNGRGVRLQTRAERAADDGLFYELILLPRQTLTFSRPTYQGGKPWVASSLWRATRDIFQDTPIQRLAIGQVIPVEQVAARDEAALSVVAGLVDEDERVLGAYRWLLFNQRAYWRQVATGHDIESYRMNGRHFNRFSGVLEDADLIQIVQSRLGPGRMWSATQLNDYGLCPFRFYAKHLLHLEALEEPEEGFDARQRGTLTHAILERTYRLIQDQGLLIELDNLGHALELLEQAANEILHDAPQRYGFRQGTLWEQEQAVLLRMLARIIQVDFSDDPKINPLVKHFGKGARTPYILEAPFGRDTIVEVDLGAEAGRIKLRGFIDRMDQLGDIVLVIDYKSGSTLIPVHEMEAGRNFQMMVYLEGAHSLIENQLDAPDKVGGGLFWHLSNQSISGVIQLDEAGHQSIEIARKQLAAHIKAGREGNFAVHASKLDSGRCVRYCDYHRLCRIANRM